LTIANVIRERRSIKKGYKADPVPEELVLELLNDAVYAPTHGLRQPWRFLFVSSERKAEFAQQLAQVYPPAEQEKRRAMYNEPSAYLVVIMREDPRQKQWEEDFSAACALIQNFQLLAWERNLGVCWKTNMHNWDPKARELMGVQPGEKIVGFLHLGFFDPADVPQAAPRIPAEQKFTRF